jgi:hypothetical protein
MQRSLLHLAADARSLAVLRILRHHAVAARYLSTLNPNAQHRLDAISANSDPRKHAPIDQARIYFPNSQFTSILRKHALPRQLEKEVDSFGKLGLILREPAANVIGVLKNAGQNESRLVLHGRPGSGKSASLLNIIHFCAASGWIVAHVPFGLNWTHRSGDLDRSLFASGQVDQSGDAAAWLQYFMASNHTMLTSTVMEGKYTWGSRKIVMPEKSSLLQLCNLGIREQRFASDVVGVLLKELRQHSNAPILIAIDEASAFLEETTGTFGFDRRLLKPQQLSLVDHFLGFIDGRKHLKSGAVVLATSSGQGILPTKATTPGTANFLSNAPVFPATSKKSFVQVQVPPFTDAEVATQLEYYQTQGWVRKQVDAKFQQGLKHLTDNLPGNIAQVARAI